MDGRVYGDALEDFAEDLPLDRAHVLFRRFNQSDAAGALLQYAIGVVAQARIGRSGEQAFRIGEPIEFRRGEAKPLGERGQGGDVGQVPTGGGGRRPHDGRWRNELCKAEVAKVPCALECWVTTEELVYVTKARTRAGGEPGQISACNRPEPAPLAA
jgi:hypothetical protein